MSDDFARRVSEWASSFAQLDDCEHLLAGWCYVVAASREHVKIGSCRTSKPDALVGRLKTIQALCPSRISLLRLFTGGRAREMALHRQFSSSRLHGEWFSALVLSELPLSGCPDCDLVVIPGGFRIHPDDLALIRGGRP